MKHLTLTGLFLLFASMASAATFLVDVPEGECDRTMNYISKLATSIGAGIYSLKCENNILGGVFVEATRANPRDFSFPEGDGCIVNSSYVRFLETITPIFASQVYGPEHRVEVYLMTYEGNRTNADCFQVRVH